MTSALIFEASALSNTTGKEGFHAQVLRMVKNVFSIFLAKFFLHDRETEAIFGFLQSFMFTVIASELNQLSLAVTEEARSGAKSKVVSHSRRSFGAHEYAAANLLTL